MRQIATELGCSSTTAYRYFENKDEILVAVRASAFNRFCQVMEDATRLSPDPRKATRNVGQAYLEFALLHPDACRMMFDISQAEVIGQAYVTPLIHDDILRGDAHALGQTLWAAAHGLVMLRLSGIVTCAFWIGAGSAMAMSLCLGLAAVRRRDIPAHPAWMLRGYALALGAGMQAVTHLPWYLLPDIQGEVARTLLIAAGWAINLAVAEWSISRDIQLPHS